MLMMIIWDLLYSSPILTWVLLKWVWILLIWVLGILNGMSKEKIIFMLIVFKH